MTFDVSIVGAGILGCSVAFQLKQRNPKLKVALIEKEASIAQHQTGNNSGVIHSGIYYTPGSAKAVNCKRGYDLLLDFCHKQEINYELCGKVIVATSEKERPLLRNIYDRGVKNGLSDIQMISAEKTREIEPFVNVVEAIKVPQTGIIDYKRVSEEYLKIFQKAGGEVFFSHKVEAFSEKNGLKIIQTSQKKIETKMIVSCAGLYSDKIAEMTGMKVNYKIIPFRGEYYTLKKEKEHMVKGLIYPVPNPDFPFLGVHYTKMINGGVEAGPNAVFAFKREGYNRTDISIKELTESLSYSGFRTLAAKYWKTGLGEMYRSFSKTAFVKALQHLIPEVSNEDLKRGNAGVRAQAVTTEGNLVDDFLILEKEGVINVCNAPSPAATSSLAIGESIVQRILKQI